MKNQVQKLIDMTPEKDKEQADYYFDNGLLVFTEFYHKKRGYCCKSGCRHCPYGYKKER